MGQIIHEEDLSMQVGMNNDLNHITPNDKLQVKAILQGSLLILISNLIYIGNNYLVSWTQLAAPEVALVRGALQVAIFAVLVARTRATGLDISGTKNNRLGLYAWLVLYGFTISTASFACIAAIPYMPIGDLIVICFTSPVFSVVIDRVVNKTFFTILSISLCFFIIVGDVLVIQPPFLFPSDVGPYNKTKPLIAEETKSDEKHGHNYYFGVALCLYAAAAMSVSNVVGAKCNKVNITTSQLMLVSGFSSVLLSLVSTIFLTNRVLTNPTSLPTRAAALLPVSGCITMVAYWTITLAISITGNPTLIAMLRSTEILISLVTESIWWSQVPGSLSLIGALLVSFCVISMAGHDKIITVSKKFWNQCFGTSPDQTSILKDIRL